MSSKYMNASYKRFASIGGKITMGEHEWFQLLTTAKDIGHELDHHLQEFTDRCTWKPFTSMLDAGARFVDYHGKWHIKRQAAHFTALKHVA